MPSQYGRGSPVDPAPASLHSSSYTQTRGRPLEAPRVKDVWKELINAATPEKIKEKEDT